jgi:hypothetical protein
MIVRFEIRVEWLGYQQTTEDQSHYASKGAVIAAAASADLARIFSIIELPTELAGVVEQSPRCRANMVRARGQQFRFAAITVEHADSGHAVVSRSNHVVASISNHRCLRRVNARRPERVAQKVGLLGTSAIQFGTEHAFEIGPQLEVIDNALGVNAGFAGRNKQAPA